MAEMALDSSYTSLCNVRLPYRGRQMYMHTFNLANPVMAVGYEDYEPIVRVLCLAAGATEGVAHMTVDEQVVTAGRSQRRPGPHVDGCFMPAAMSWGHQPSPGQPSPGGTWNHNCNNIGTYPGRMAVIVAASVEGCRAWAGRFTGEPASDGDLAHIADQLGAGEVLPAGVGYLLSPDCVHESMTFAQDTQRTFLRIALPPTFALPAPPENG